MCMWVTHAQCSEASARCLGPDVAVSLDEEVLELRSLPLLRAVAVRHLQHQAPLHLGRDVRGHHRQQKVLLQILVVLYTKYF